MLCNCGEQMVAIEGVKGTYTDASITGITCWFCQGCGNAIDVARVDTQDGVYKDIDRKSVV